MSEKAQIAAIKKLQKEVAELRLLVMQGHDPEGEYRPEFIRKMKQISKNPGKVHNFTTAEDFLQRLDATNS